MDFAFSTTPSPSLPLFSRESIRRVETEHPGGVLMARAAKETAEWAQELCRTSADPILVLAGVGNNGGDAISAAILLRQAGLAVITLFPGRGHVLSSETDAACQQFVASGGKFSADIPGNTRFSLIIDGLFGIGLSRPPEGHHAYLIETANRISREQNCPMLALDCPSGLDADCGFAYPPTIVASHTLTFIAAKPGLYTGDGPDYCGEIRIADLGLKDISARADGRLLSTELFAHCLRPRPANSHKGNYGNIGILGGATAMQGAVLLAGRAALKLGAGKVYVGMFDAKAVDFVHPELMLRQAARIFDTPLAALACGPGMGLVGQAREILPRVLSMQTSLILDADALNLLASVPSLSAMSAQIQARRKQGFPTILTPHPVEAARLLASTAAAVQQNRVGSALELARRFQAWVALKGCGSVIASPDGQWWINTSGNPGMAGPGFGDVLTGFIATLAGQGWPPKEALLTAVHLHGRAADDLVAAGIGPVGLTAGEVIDAARIRFNRWLDKDFS
ncbi:MAG: NAD(P)H-hydrate dehydratase [Betaproteobacteria bacterium]|nr:NAD(P)H-hydrate dehydratase [Betaproteobacteria bacterium]